MKHYIIALIIFSFLSCVNEGIAQNYTSAADGIWESAANWTNTSGNGAAFPATNGGYGSRILNHNQTISGNLNTGSADLTIAAGKSLTVNGNFTSGGGSKINVNGTLEIIGNASISGNQFNISSTGKVIVNGETQVNQPVNTSGLLKSEGSLILSAKLQINPGGQAITKMDVTVNNSKYLYVGTNVAPPQFADLIVYGNLNAVSSGDVYVLENGRVAIFGDVNDNGGGGTILSLSDGAQMYVDGDINYSGGGSKVQNNNSADPYGLYVNGSTTTNTGQGGSATTNIGDKQTLIDTNPDFLEFLAGVENSPLPIELTSFEAQLKFNQVQLNWTTAKEENFSHFEVERKTGQADFEPIGFVQGAGESLSELKYDYVDYNAPFGKVLYRLKSVDHDGSFKYSSIITITKSLEGKINISPNPAKIVDQISINLPAEVNKNLAKVELYDLNGMLIQQELNVDASKPISVEKALRAGMYIIKVQYNGLEENMRLIIQ